MNKKRKIDQNTMDQNTMEKSCIQWINHSNPPRLLYIFDELLKKAKRSDYVLNHMNTGIQASLEEYKKEIARKDRERFLEQRKPGTICWVKIAKNTVQPALLIEYGAERCKILFFTDSPIDANDIKSLLFLEFEDKLIDLKKESENEESDKESEEEEKRLFESSVFGHKINSNSIEMFEQELFKLGDDSVPRGNRS